MWRMRSIISWLWLFSAVSAQFFGNQPNQQQYGQNTNSNGQHPYQNSQQLSFGQRSNPPQPQNGGIHRSMSQNTMGQPQNSPQQQNQQNQQNLQNQQQLRNFQQSGRSQNLQQSNLQQHNSQQSNRESSFLQSAANQFQSHIVKPLESAASQVKQAIARPGAVFNRFSSNQDNSWTGSSGSNSPGIFVTPTRNNVPLNPGATFYIQLSSYTNQGLNMKGGTTCYCPRDQCTILENILHPCYFTFTIVVSTASGEPIHYISKEFVAVNSTGQPSPSSGDWTVPVTLQLVSKPTYIDIFVNNLGPVIQGRTVNYLDEFWQVDTFTIDLSDYTPTIANQQPQPVTTRLNGQLVRSTLEVNYYVQCQAGLLGDSCDLQCQPTKQAEPPRTVCSSRITNVSSICGLDSSRSQVQNCQICGYGVIDEKCADLAALQSRELGVNSAFRVWTIILAILLAIALILICILIGLGVRQSRKQQDRERELRTRRVEPIFNDQPNFAAYDNRHNVGNPLLQNNDEWNKPPQPHIFNRPAGIESESNHSDTVPRNGTSAPAGYSQQTRREAQV
ncbi:hypothetical protein M3Y98_00337400 [Aphelenchoides besseyi]|nr:hypothetical protein M3Y98_00337400 [Aphelenchoides besseyi]KAI6201571.1 hypothetical protein M3Y96_00856500 [Aphelenchoides besseyi]